jgi:TIR domain-containing protein
VKAEPYRVFISHSSRDSWMARIMAEKVAALGAETWLDVKNLGGGDVIDQEVLKGIDACQEAIVLISSESVGSQWVLFEIGAVWGQHKRITPIVNNVSHDDITPLRSIKAIDLNDFDRFLGELENRIRQSKDPGE